MFIRKLEDCQGTPRQVFSETGTWDSVRMILKEDDVGFSFHITTIKAGSSTYINYKNHVECVYCVSGDMRIQELKTGTVHDITPGTMYMLYKGDEHRLMGGTEDCVVTCVFNPPIVGNEVHGPDGAYALVD